MRSTFSFLVQEKKKMVENRSEKKINFFILDRLVDVSNKKADIFAK